MIIRLFSSFQERSNLLQVRCPQGLASQVKVLLSYNNLDTWRQPAPGKQPAPGDSQPRETTSPGRQLAPGDNLPWEKTFPGRQSLSLTSKMAQSCLFCLWSMLYHGEDCLKSKLSSGRIVYKADCFQGTWSWGILSLGYIISGKIVLGNTV